MANLIQKLIDRIRALMAGDAYRPEQHYMRGPGPKSQSKPTQASDGAD